ncbi:MAG TPA: MFS transporter [Alphaproteobacteria bacterium]|nr:MFS transporter [Alphaproteobacteria bacterium]
MLRTLTSSWPLFFGLALIMIGNGLQGTLLGVRATIEGFDTATIGLIMSLYYLGYLAGSIYVPKMVSKVGHIRVFTALASLASTTVLLHGLYPDPWLWAIIRAFTGFAYAGLYIVVESWLNDLSTNKTRGQVLSLYLLITNIGLVGGQFLLTVADPEQIDLFIMTSVLVSIALLPISLSSRPAPAFDEPEKVPLKKLYKISPLGLVGSFGIGITNGTMFSMAAVYATAMDLSLAQISTFMAAYIIGGVAFQIPIGKLSDRYDRRKVIIAVTLAASLVGFLCFLASGMSLFILYAALFVFGGLSLTIYGLCLAHTNDHLEPRQFVAASSSMILVNGLGAAIGPFAISVFMSIFGIQYFFPIIAMTFFALSAYGFHRTNMRAPVPLEEQTDHIVLPTTRPTPLSLAITEEGHAIMKEMEKDA